MTLRSVCYVGCNGCGKEGPIEESNEDAKDAATQAGFVVDVKVPNGSRWDFCPKCYTKYVNETVPKHSKRNQP